MKRQISLLPVTVVAMLLTLLPFESAYAHHEAWLGSAFWHNLAHALGYGVPLLIVGAVVLATMWYRRRTEI